MMGSIVASGNLRGDFAVSMSNARTTGSARLRRSSMTVIVDCPALTLTVYHFPMRRSVLVETRRGTLIDGYADMVWDIPFSSVDDVFNRIEDRSARRISF